MCLHTNDYSHCDMCPSLFDEESIKYSCDLCCEEFNTKEELQKHWDKMTMEYHPNYKKDVLK